MKKQTNMYRLSVQSWNPFVGCEYECKYCAYQAMLKRQPCPDCKEYSLHKHPERLTKPLRNTKYMHYIFTISTGDVAFCDTDYLKQILNRIRNEKNKTFLIQSKDPSTFNRVKFPNNVVLGTTIETDDDELYVKHKISKAPLPSKRYKDFLEVKHHSKMVTIEPVIKFTDNLVRWIEDIDPVIVWLGRDSKNCYLPEPSHEKFMRLYSDIGLLHIPIDLKKIK